jgi:hypothetical protein
MVLKKIYVSSKFIVPRLLQIQLRRYHVHRQHALHAESWPIDRKSAKPPEGWAGWPDEKKFALVLTHDVESAKGINKCYQLMEIEERLGFRSSFNFVPGDYTVPVALLQQLTDHGFEVGVHGLHHNNNPFGSKSFFQKQAIQINHYLKEWGSVGFRSPCMYHDLELLHFLNIEYDASTFDTDPFEPQPDGVGTIFPFWVSGNSSQKGYVELPYTLPQDFLLFILMKEKYIDIWRKKLDWIAHNGGMSLFITHPDYMNFTKTSHYEEYPARYYEEFLEYVKSKYEGQYWHALPRDISRFWANKYKGNTMKSKYSSKTRRKKIWIDLDNSPHVPFFKPIIEELKNRGHDVVITARDCFQVCGLADLINMEYTKIGRHYGKNKLLKAAGLLIRSFQFIPSLSKEKPHLALSHGSRSQVMISSIFNIPSALIADYEYAHIVVKPTYMIVPELISDKAVRGFQKAVYKYPGIKEDVYIPGFKPDPSIMKELNIKEGELVVTIRPPATEAHYHNPESELLFEETINFLGRQTDTRMIILPRNEKKQTAWVRSNWAEWCNSGKIIIPEHVVDGLNLIWHSDLVISGGGTMNREAAALGVPVYSIFRGKIGAVDHYLSENGRLILLENVKDIRTKIALNKRRRPETLESVNRRTINKIIEIIEKILTEAK